MEKLPPKEKIYEAFTALADGRVEMKGNSAAVISSDGSKSYRVAWRGNEYASTDNATYWQGYAGYPVICVLMLQGKLLVDWGVVRMFTGVPWSTLNKTHRRDYAKALGAAIVGLGLAQEQVTKAAEATEKIYLQLKELDVRIVRKIKEG